ncbi:MAG: DNA primase, partial [Deltaproteobacteria bacterium]|nr:DNA primase [Deltaproteobacteria bacterium]
MPRVPFESLINEILSRTSIVQIIGEFVKLKKAGLSHKGLCPFHTEKTPSFNVNEEKKLFYCFGCQKGGNAITFLQFQMGFSFRDAVSHLAKKAGMELPRDFLRERSVSDDAGEKVSALKKICELSAKFFEDALASERGKTCRDYILKRGLTGETVKLFRLGFAPDGWDNLVSQLNSRKAPLNAAAEAGLIVRKEGRSDFYDRLRNRLVFPVFNLNGEVVGFGGRTLSQDAENAKYLNTSDSPAYKKGENLFGLYQARNDIRNSGAAIVDEK